MGDYFFDSYAIIELIKGNQKYDFVKEHTIITSPMNLAEVYYSLLLSNKKETADEIMECLNAEILDINKGIALKSALYKFLNKKLKLSYIDCLGYSLAMDNDMIFLTGDKGFKNIKNVKFVPKE
jgi:uncharacterized protein